MNHSKTKNRIQTNHDRVWFVFLIFLRLGLSSFGGPIAHLGYFRNEFVTRRKWLSDRDYADLVALCQFLPGPASSQVGIAIGLTRSGYAGAVAAWVGFTLPSAIILSFLALGISHYNELIPAGALSGLKVVSVAIVAQAVWGMARHLCTDLPRISIMLISCAGVLLMPSAWGQLSMILIAAIAGLLLCKPTPQSTYDSIPVSVSHRAAVACLVLFFVLLFALPLLAQWAPNPLFALLDTFFRAGSLVFGGGHVVLPLLQAEVVPAGWVSNETFLAGYGAAQAMPGPLFTFASFLGASMPTMHSAWIGSMICLVAIFMPSFLLVIGTLPFWEQLRRNLTIQAALAGVNAAVVGLLLAALYHPVWTHAIHQPVDVALAVIALITLLYSRVPIWLVVLGCAAAGALLHAVAI